MPREGSLPEIFGYNHLEVIGYVLQKSDAVKPPKFQEPGNETCMGC